MGPHVAHIDAFLQRVAGDEAKSDESLKNLVGLLGDLAKVYKHKVAHLLSKQVFYDAINEAMQSDDNDIKATASWAQTEVSQVTGTHF